jgi:hypothetical protein
MKRILLILLLLGLIFTPANAGNVVTMFKTQGGASYKTPARVGSPVDVYDGVCSTNASKSATAGNVLVMAISGTGSQEISGVTTYTGTTSAWSALGTSTGGDVDVSFYAATVTESGTIAARPSCTTSGDAGYVMIEYSGTALTQISTIQNDGSASDTSFATANITTTTPALLVGMWASETEDKTITYGSGWSEIQNTTSHIHKVAEKITSTSSDYNFSGSWTGAASFNAAFIALQAKGI